MFKRSFSILIFCAYLLLTGCAGEPSSSEISKAVGDSFKEDSSIFTGKNLLGTLINAAGVEEIMLISVEKIGCEPSGKNTYLCEVSVEYLVNGTEGGLSNLLGISGKKRSINKYRLVKTSKGWIAIPRDT